MASLPRPSRPPMHLASSGTTPPPTGPLPSIPVPKPRQAPNPSPLSPLSSTRTSSSSSIPTSAPITPSIEPKKQVRRTFSYNSFPRPPVAGKTSPPSSSSTTPRSSVRGSNSANTTTRSASLGGPSAGALVTTPRSTPPVLQEEPSSSPHPDDSPRGRQRPASATSKDKGNVVISVRVRPEKDASNATAESAGEWTVDGKQSSIAFKGKEGGEYVYDNVFSTDDNNAKVYDSSARRLVRRVMEGYNGTVFAYGMTGTGKTYSMQGTATSPGVIPSAITDIFSYIRETPHREFLLRVSYLEIYNEKIHDLLSMPIVGSGIGVQTQDEIKLREDSKGNVYATPLKEEIVQSPTQLLRVIARGDHSRKTSATQFNIKSSRSHAVVQIVVESRERNAGANVPGTNKSAVVVPGGVRVSTLSLIDLAGSEKAADSKERRTEGAHINKSLLTLGTVISKLSGTKDKQGQPTDKDGKHLPYRDSKLTRLLQPALAGNSLISILCTIQLGSTGSSAVAGTHTIETLNTLKFAARARNNIVSHAKKAEESHGNIGDAGSRALLDRYRMEIVELRKQLEGKSEETTRVKCDEEEKQKEEEQNQRHEEQIIEIHLARTALADRIEHLNRLILSSKSTGVNQSRSYSSLNFVQQRMSNLSTVTDGGIYPRSIRSSASTQTIGASKLLRDSVDSLQNHMPISPNADEYEEDFRGINGDGNATMAAQIRALQADLADKSRYIEDLQRKLAQARRSSRSRVSLMLANRQMSNSDAGGAEALLQEKDAEIAELREQLDDKDRMLSALKSATRKRDTADLTPIATPPPSTRRTSSQTSAGAEAKEISTAPKASRRTSLASTELPTTVPNGGNTRSTTDLHRRSSAGPGVYSTRNLITSPLASMQIPSDNIDRSTPSTISSTPDGQAVTSPSRPLSPRGPRTPRKNHGVDEMTRMLDDMIRQKVDEEKMERSSVSPPGNTRTNSLNLLAMRDVPVAKRRYSARISDSPKTPLTAEHQGLGITSGIDGAVVSGANGILGHRRHTSLLLQSQVIASGLDETHAAAISAPGTSAAPNVTTPSITKGASGYNRSTAAASQATDALRNLSGYRSNSPVGGSDEEGASSTGDTSTIVNGETSRLQNLGNNLGNESSMQRVAEIVKASAS